MAEAYAKQRCRSDRSLRQEAAKTLTLPGAAPVRKPCSLSAYSKAARLSDDS